MDKVMTVTELLGMKNILNDGNATDRFYQLRDMVNADMKIPFIRAIREWYNVGLKNARDIQIEVFGILDTKAREHVLQYIASGHDSMNYDKINAGIEICLNNWQVLGYTSVHDAIIEFVNRVR